MSRRAACARELSVVLKGLVLAIGPIAVLAACGASTSGGSAGDAGTDGPTTVPPVTGGGGGCVTDTGYFAYPDCSADAGADADADAASPCFADGGLDCSVICRTGAPYTVACSPAVGDAGEMLVACSYTRCGSGRRHAGLAPMRARASGSALGCLFAEVAYLEDASVVSFEILARELRAHGAPRALVLAAEKSARDEVRHARATAALARRHGAHVETVARRRAPRVRKLLDIAIENAAEGCVRETYGALLATHQAAHARDPKIRAVMTRIAKDETEHAALAWRIRAWAFGRLDARGRRAVDGAERQALAALHEELVAEPDSSVVRDAGVPTSARARMLLDALTAELRAA